MTDDDDDLRINTLHRFVKQSPRLVLHEYSHCEVPAGCGGVVLRWIDPAQGRPANLRLFNPHGTSTAWLDGTQLASGLVLLRTGVRLVALHLRREQPGSHPFTFTALWDGQYRNDLVSRGSPQWRCAKTQPPDTWMNPEFSDLGWSVVPAATEPMIATQEDYARRSFDRALEEGQPVLAFDGKELWVRLAFTVTE